MKKALIVAAIVLVPLAPILLVVTGVIGKKATSVDPITLTYWTVQNTPEDIAPLVAAYQRLHPYVTINVVQRAPTTYATDLITAWAKGEGPDLFSLPQENLGGFRDFIAPMPPATRVAFYIPEQTLFRTETRISYRTEPTLAVERLRADFVDTVAKDVVATDGAVLGLPLSVDSLALYYNRDILASAGVAEPPKTWQEFSELVPKLTQVDAQDNIIQAGAGIGVGSNVRHGVDLLALLILQNGSAVIDATGREVLFTGSVGGEALGSRAVEFYTDFSSSGKEVYTWNAKLSDSLEQFLQGKVAFYFGTANDRRSIDQQAVRLNYAVAPMLHLSESGLDNDLTTGRPKQINIANYWVETVSARSAHQNEAWHFVQFATRAGVVDAYLAQTSRPAALTSLVAKQAEDLTVGIFAKQSLNALGWYRGLDAKAARTALNDMLDRISANHSDLSTAMNVAAQQVLVTLPRR
jgi:multiple sugar transport system substrate-binding protein